MAGDTPNSDGRNAEDQDGDGQTSDGRKKGPRTLVSAYRYANKLLAIIMIGK